MSELQSRLRSTARTACAGVAAAGCVIIPGLIGLKQGINNERQHNAEALADAKALRACRNQLAAHNLLGRTLSLNHLSLQVGNACSDIIPSERPTAPSISAPDGALVSYETSVLTVTLPSADQLKTHIEQLLRDGNDFNDSEALQPAAALASAGLLLLIGAVVSLDS